MHTTPDNVRVLIVGRIPPPYLGAPIMLEHLVRSEMPGVELRHLPIRLSADDTQVGKFHWAKLLRLFLFIPRILYARFVLRSQILYYAPELVTPRTTVLRDAAILAASRPFFSKTVLHLHASGIAQLYGKMPGWQRWLVRRGFYHADAVIRLSSLAPNDGQQLKARHEYVVPNGIDDIGRDRRAVRPARQITKQAPLRLLFVALLSEAKGLWVLIDACAKLAAQEIPIQLDVMGNFESLDFESRTRAKVAELSLNDNVRFLGHLNGPEKLAAFIAADALCHPTFYDTFALVIIEAMACTLPVVATNWSSIPSMVDEGKTGFLVEPHDPDAVADRLSRLVHNPQLRVQMGLAGREKFLREFTLSRHLERMRAVFLDVAGVSPAEKCVHDIEELLPRMAEVKSLISLR
jgi:glycosyltransferase involved in cell wall biosynthesis